MMAKCILTAVGVVSIFLFQLENLPAQGREDGTVVETFLGGLKRGERGNVLGLLTGPLLDEKRDLVNNSEYANFLKQRYKNASFVIKGIGKIDTRTRAVDVAIYLNPQEPPLETRFIIQRQKGSWKIVEEIADTDL